MVLGVEEGLSRGVCSGVKEVERGEGGMKGWVQLEHLSKSASRHHLFPGFEVEYDRVARLEVLMVMQ